MVRMSRFLGWFSLWILSIIISRIEWEWSWFSGRFSPWILLVIISRIWWECLGFQADSHLESHRLSSKELGENVQVFRLVLTLNLINYHLKNRVKMSKFSSQFSSWILSIIISGIGWECPGFQAGSHLESLQWYHWIPYSSWKLIIVITWLVFFVKQKSYLGLVSGTLPNFNSQP